MHLIIFDIDGTLVDSVDADDTCFIQAFGELFDIDLTGADWNQFPHVTDSGLTESIFQQYRLRSPTKKELQQLKTRFFQLLEQHVADFSAVPGANQALNWLNQHPEFKVALATGGWRETAELKLKAAGIPFAHIPFISANEHYDRAVIIQLAIRESLRQSMRDSFEAITYVGDGLWDLKTSQVLGIHFIGVDVRGNGKLAATRAKWVLNDLTSLPGFLNGMQWR